MNNHEEEEFNVEGYGYKGYQEDPLFQDEPLYQEEAFDDADEDFEDEDFPEPAGDQAPKKGLPKSLVYGLGAVAVLAASIGGAFMLSPESFEALNPETLMASFSGEEAAAPEEAPEPAATVRPRRPVKPPVAAKPKPAAVANAKSVEFKLPSAPKPPAAKPKPVVKSQPVAAKPRPRPVVAAVAPRPAAPSQRTAVAFANGSYWVAAAEMEKLWAFSSTVKSGSGLFTVESWVTTEPEGATLSRKRADRIAELLVKNNQGTNYRVNVKVHGGEASSQMAARRVNVTFTSKL